MFRSFELSNGIIVCIELKYFTLLTYFSENLPKPYSEKRKKRNHIYFIKSINTVLLVSSIDSKS